MSALPPYFHRRSAHTRAKQRAARKRQLQQLPAICKNIVENIHEHFMHNIPLPASLCCYCAATACAETEKDVLTLDELEWVYRTVQVIFQRKPGCALCPVGIPH